MAAMPDDFGDVGDEAFCRQAVQQTVHHFDRLDILVNNAAVQFLKRASLISMQSSWNGPFVPIYSRIFLWLRRLFPI
jgi:NAD(P)-dependent dehydrogenase (short-subunit alcohol dehydrogenase family)